MKKHLCLVLVCALILTCFAGVCSAATSAKSDAKDEKLRIFIETQVVPQSVIDHARESFSSISPEDLSDMGFTPEEASSLKLAQGFKGEMYYGNSVVYYFPAISHGRVVATLVVLVQKDGSLGFKFGKDGMEEALSTISTTDSMPATIVISEDSIYAVGKSGANAIYSLPIATTKFVEKVKAELVAGLPESMRQGERTVIEIGEDTAYPNIPYKPAPQVPETGLSLAFESIGGFAGGMADESARAKQFARMGFEPGFYDFDYSCFYTWRGGKDENIKKITLLDDGVRIDYADAVFSYRYGKNHSLQSFIEKCELSKAPKTIGGRDIFQLKSKACAELFWIQDDTLFELSFKDKSVSDEKAIASAGENKRSFAEKFPAALDEKQTKGELQPAVPSSAPVDFMLYANVKKGGAYFTGELDIEPAARIAQDTLLLVTKSTSGDFEICIRSDAAMNSRSFAGKSDRALTQQEYDKMLKIAELTISKKDVNVTGERVRVAFSPKMLGKPVARKFAIDSLSHWQKALFDATGEEVSQIMDFALTEEEYLFKDIELIFEGEVINIEEYNGCVSQPFEGFYPFSLLSIKVSDVFYYDASSLFIREGDVIHVYNSSSSADGSVENHILKQGDIAAFFATALDYDYWGNSITTANYSLPHPIDGVVLIKDGRYMVSEIFKSMHSGLGIKPKDGYYALDKEQFAKAVDASVKKFQSAQFDA